MDDIVARTGSTSDGKRKADSSAGGRRQGYVTLPRPHRNVTVPLFPSKANLVPTRFLLVVLLLSVTSPRMTLRRNRILTRNRRTILLAVKNRMCAFQRKRGTASSWRHILIHRSVE